MKKNAFLMSGLVTAFLFFFSMLHANHLNGLWHNDRQNITVRIKQDEDGFRAKRTDQAVWYRYSLKSDNVYVDRFGNWYELLDQNRIEWNEARSSKRIVFTKVDSDDSRYDDDDQDWDQDSDNWNDDGWNDDRSYNRTGSVQGRWYDKTNKDRLEIEFINGGYRVKTQHGAWEKYISDRNGNRLRSRSGNVIQMLDRNTIRWNSYQGRHQRIYTRQGNGNNPDKWNDRHQDSKHKHGKKHC